MIADALHCVANHRQSLSREEARAVMTEVLTGKCTDAQIAALLVALHMKGETVEEIVGFAEAIRAAAAPLELHANSVLDASGTGRDALVDTCGTGGDTSGTFNISTATAFVAAGAGVRVAKHGNRSVLRSAAQPTSWKLWASTSTCRRLESPPALSRLASHFSLPRRCTPP